MPRKVAERIYLEWFINKVGRNQCSVYEGEAPDFAIGFDDKKVGVEVTNLFVRENYKDLLRNDRRSFVPDFLRILHKGITKCVVCRYPLKFFSSPISSQQKQIA